MKLHLAPLALAAVASVSLVSCMGPVGLQHTQPLQPTRDVESLPADNGATLGEALIQRNAIDYGLDRRGRGGGFFF